MTASERGRLGGIASGKVRKAKATGSHVYTVLGTRVCLCGCGRAMTITTRNRDQRYASVGCLRDLKKEATARMRKRSTYAQRRARFMALIEQMLQRDTVTRGMLLELAAQSYKQGYNAGYATGATKPGRVRRAA